jgi:hypothetical protein
MDYWVSVERVYKIVSEEELTQQQAQALIEEGRGNLKEVNWDFDEQLLIELL